MNSEVRNLRVAISSDELHAAAQKIKGLRSAATQNAIEIGRELLCVKEKLPHGAFAKWVERACEFKIRTAQDLMKLAREAEPDAKIVALMVPSTLRVYLSKKTPPAVRVSLLQRLEKGEHISRSSLYSQLANAKGEARAERFPETGPGALMKLAIQGPSREYGAHRAEDRARQVAELLLRRLSPQDHALIMQELDWETWNRAFVWMRAAHAVDAERVEITVASSSSETAVSTVSAKLQ